MLSDTDCVSRLHPRNLNRKGILPLIANMLFVSIIFLAGKDFCEISTFCVFIMLCNFRP